MKPNSLLVFGLLLLSLAAAYLGAGPALAASFERIATIQVPGEKLVAFDISWIDRTTRLYYLADRSNKGIDIVNMKDNTFVGRIGGFVGPSTKSDTAGPNGIVVVPELSQLWAADGDSTVKVVDLKSGKIIDSISTGGTKRADEIAYDPQHQMILAANNADKVPFVTFISTKPNDRRVLGKLEFPNASEGLEQPVWDPTTQLFYISVPEVGGVKANGEIAVIDPMSMKVVKAYPVIECQPAGLVASPHKQLLVACGQDAVEKGFAPRSIILDVKTGAVVKTITQVGGSDEAWYNPGDDRFYLAARGMVGGPVLGVVNAKTGEWIANIPTWKNAKSVAVDPENNHIFVPLTPNPADPACVNGCIAVYAGR